MSLTHDEVFHAFYLPGAGQEDDEIIINHLVRSNVMDMHLSLGGGDTETSSEISSYATFFEFDTKPSQKF